MRKPGQHLRHTGGKDHVPRRQEKSYPMNIRSVRVQSDLLQTYGILDNRQHT